MHMIIAPSRLGGGPNLVCTTLMRVLMHRARESDVPLGQVLMLRLDNTTGENKCKTLFRTAAWLVQRGKFNSAIVGFQPKGHTYNLLDQVFRYDAGLPSRRGVRAGAGLGGDAST